MTDPPTQPQIPRRHLADLTTSEQTEILQARLTGHKSAWIEKNFNVHRRTIRAIVDHHQKQPHKAEPDGP